MSHDPAGDAGPAHPDAPDAPAPAAGDALAPSRIGPYRILRHLGEGGMGVVYLAEQLEPVRREVALKLLRTGVDTRQFVARFEAERQALAVMDHPGITRVFDAGTTDAGWPYFVMERVDGVPLTAYATAHRLSLRDRVRLLAQVCRAVQHAHQKGIIHRDLKPSNVLVTEADGEPLCKVIDFGIARAVEPAAGAEQLTRTGLALGTPAYMSPEQAFGSGLDVDTRTDVYSLGVMLYELLTDRLPFDASAYRGVALLVHHATKDPPSPSGRVAALGPEEQAQVAAARRVEVAALRRELSGELGWIVLRAIDRERDRRYETASALAADLERYLRHEPVSAAAPSAAYRARKFVRRHRASVAFAATVLVLLVGFSAATAVQARRLAVARDLAASRQGQAEELIGFMLGDLRGQLTQIGRLDVLDQVGARALAYFAAVPESELSDAELFRRTQALRQLGEVRVDQGKLAEAMDAFRQSLALAEGLARRDSLNGEWQVGLGASRFWVGFIHWRQGTLDSALAHFEPYLDIGERLVARWPDSLAYRQELGYAHSNLGSVREAQGDLPGALEAFRATLATHEHLARADSTNLENVLDLANTHNTVGVIQRKLGELAGAVASHRTELALKQSLAARDTANHRWRQAVASGHAFLGVALLARGDVDSAVASFEAAHAIRAALAGRDRTNAERQRSLANVERLLAQALLERGDVGAALRHLAASTGALERLVAGEPGNQEWGRELARARLTEGQALLAAGRAGAAVQATRRAIAVAEPATGAACDGPDQCLLVGEGYLLLGDAQARLGDATAAGQAWRRAVHSLDSLARTARQTDLLATTAIALVRLQRTAEAEPLLRELERRGYRRPSFTALARAPGR